MTKLKVNIIGGFLGSGKTTLLRYFLSQPRMKERAAVLVNELGEAGIDGKILQRPGLRMMELTNGCICCQVTGDLIQAVQDIQAQYQPERLLIETTGVAEPGKVLTVLYSPFLADRVRVEPTLGVVDMAGFDRLYRELAYHYVMQIKASDILILNKMDLVTPSAARRAEREIQKLNPRAFRVRTTRGRVDLLNLLEGEAGGVPEEEKEVDHPPESFSSFVFRSAAHFDDSKLEKVLKGLPSDCYRAKGFVHTPGGWVLMNYITGQTEWEPWPEWEAPSETQLVFIGRRLPRERILENLKRCELRKAGVGAGGHAKRRKNGKGH